MGGGGTHFMLTDGRFSGTSTHASRTSTLSDDGSESDMRQVVARIGLDILRYEDPDVDRDAEIRVHALDDRFGRIVVSVDLLDEFPEDLDQKELTEYGVFDEITIIPKGEIA